MNKLNGFLLIGASLLMACGASTTLTGRWKEPTATTTYKNIFIAAMTEKTSNKQTAEQAMADELKIEGVSSTKSGDMFPYKFTHENKPSKEELIEKIRQNGNDAIITFALIKKKEEVRYVPGNNNAYAPYGGPYGYYGNFGGYYGYYGYRSYDPGYYTEDEVYFIETNVYDVKSEKLVWSAQSKTLNPAGLEEFAHDVTSVITKQLIKDGLIESNNPKYRKN